jgi:hypothetical protein
MIFLAGPRQVGKTTLAKKWLEQQKCSKLYYNWDNIKTRQAYRKDSHFFESPARTLHLDNPWIVFDEIHKRNGWKSILKGVYDIFQDEFRFLITGSARLDLFRRSGDSLVGRFNMFHMMPFSLCEVLNYDFQLPFLAEKNIVSSFYDRITQQVQVEVTDAFNNLLNFGPFPEPFTSQTDRFSTKWHQDYSSLLIHQDLKDISRVVELDKIEQLFEILSTRLMSPLSMPNLGNDLETSHTTIKTWLEQLKRLYLIFPVLPWSKNILRGLKKEKKWYYLNWYFADNKSSKLENMVASNLYRTCLTLTDMGYGKYKLFYLRTIDKQEIDFIITKNNQPVVAVEVKTGDTSLSKTLKNRSKWFKDLPCIGLQVVNKRNILKKIDDTTWIVSVERFFKILP